jgi:demethylspheroidene O-methyltransferase
MVARPEFRRWAGRFWATRGMSRNRAATLFDLAAGFVYSQILLACVQLDLFTILAEGPQTLGRLAGRLNLSDQGLALREALVLETVLSRGVALAGVLGGGYDTDLEALAQRHMLLHKAASAAHARWR